MFFVILIQLNLLFRIVSPRCSRPLGMKSGGILDFQITATSAFQEHEPHEARPQGEGWCAFLDDPTPYLQVKQYLFHK